MAKKQQQIALSSQEFTRLANNFYISKSIAADPQRISIDAELVNFILSNAEKIKQKHKVALCFICINPPYWEFIQDAVAGAQQFFLPGHNTDIFLWTDMPAHTKEIKEKLQKFIVPDLQDDPATKENLSTIASQLSALRKTLNVCEVGSIDWPMGTLMRYSMMLQKEEELKDYDYVFYCDIDMRFVNVVGDEILGDELTAAQHPMYALRKEYYPPYEPNEKSTAYIKRPGKVVEDNGKPRFLPLYYAGGFQGGKTEAWLKAMREMKKNIDADFTNDYVAIWNDESHWNKYLTDNVPSVVLTPSYIYPDSLIDEYYVKIWGTNYQPRLITLTKRFSTSSEGGQAVQEMIKNI